MTSLDDFQMQEYNLKADSLTLVDSSDLIPSARPFMVVAGYALPSFILLCFFLASIFKYPAKVTGNGSIRPDGETKLVQSSFEGTIENINVSENEFVEKGDVLATLNNQSLRLREEALLNSIDNAQAELTSIKAQKSSLNIRTTSEVSNVQRTVLTARANLEIAEREYLEMVSIAQSQVEELKTEVLLAKTEYERYQILAAQGAASLQQRDEKLQVLKSAEYRLEQAKVKLNPLDSPILIAQEQIAQEKLRGKAILATLDQEMQSLVQREIQLSEQLNRSKSELEDIRKSIDKHIIISPVSGTVLDFTLRNQGQVITVSEKIASISPVDDSLVARIRVGARDIAQVQVGQKVYLKISAFPYPDHGVLYGSVVEVSPDSIGSIENNDISVRQNNNRSSNSFYEVVVEPDSLFMNDTTDQAIQPGMEVTAEIVTREETLVLLFLRKARLFLDV
jgi:HlyD family type I secretion membrane fusion protein